MVVCCKMVMGEKHYEPVIYIEFPLDGNKNFCYRSRTSYNAFNNFKKNRHTNGKIRYACNHDTSLPIEITKPYSLPPYNIETIVLKDLWEFYEYIGYDYKTKKYNG